MCPSSPARTRGSHLMSLGREIMNYTQWQTAAAVSWGNSSKGEYRRILRCRYYQELFVGLIESRWNVTSTTSSRSSEGPICCIADRMERLHDSGGCLYRAFIRYLVGRCTFARKPSPTCFDTALSHTRTTYTYIRMRILHQTAYLYPSFHMTVNPFRDKSCGMS